MSKNKNKNKNSSSQTNTTDRSREFERFIKFDRYLTDNNFSKDYFHSALFQEFFDGTFAGPTLRSDSFRTFTLAGHKLAMTMRFDHTRPCQSEQIIINYLIHLIQKKYETGYFPGELVFRCPTGKLAQLTESLDNILAITGELYCNRADEQLGDYLTITDVKIIEGYIVGTTTLDEAVDVQITFSDWIRHILMTKTLRSGANYLIYDQDWIDSELSLKS